MKELLSTISLGDLVTAFVALASACLSAWTGYLVTVKKIGVESKTQLLTAQKTAEQEFRDDLIKQLEDSSARLDRQMQRLDEREKKNAELLKQIDDAWSEKSELKAEIATLKAELTASLRKNKDLASELEKFEKKVFYIAKSDSAPVKGDT